MARQVYLFKPLGLVYDNLDRAVRSAPLVLVVSLHPQVTNTAVPDKHFFARMVTLGAKANPPRREPSCRSVEHFERLDVRCEPEVRTDGPTRSWVDRIGEQHLLGVAGRSGEGDP